MTQSLGAEPIDPDRARESIAAPVIVWTVIQLIALLLSAARVPLWARSAHPAEQDALWIMLSAQSAASALLFPWLLRNGRAKLYVIVTAILFEQLAGILADQSLNQTLPAMVGMVMLLVGLTLWSGVLVERRWQMMGIAIAGSVVIGGGALVYLRSEFAVSDENWGMAMIVWIGLSANLALSGAATVIWRRKRRLIHSQPTAFPQPDS